MDIDRRELIKRSALGVLAFRLGGVEVLLSPRQARAEGVPFATLSEQQAGGLAALGEVLAPGAEAAGIAHYVDSQLTGDSGDSLLMIRYLGVPAPHADFYGAGLAALDRLAGDRFGRDFAELDPDPAIELVTAMRDGTADGWQGPPAPFFYFVVRGDAVDVVYGTLEGFDKLGVPYMAHIEPPASRW